MREQNTIVVVYTARRLKEYVAVDTVIQSSAQINRLARLHARENEHTDSASVRITRRRKKKEG